ncbi:hypothetical protein SDC9_140384 [bioreactor metagenome]|uniref:Uncharacterized protein n=1 Tax=bioreactor metagenome TaxID=1076179 RepID=A0A645DVU6_9ZZZZ
MISRAALNGEGDDVSCALVGFFLCFGLNVTNQNRRFMSGLPLHIGEQHVARVLHGKPGDFFEFMNLLVVEGLNGCFCALDLRFAVRDCGLSFIERIRLFVKDLLPLENAPLVSLYLSAALTVFSFRFGANFKYFFFCL